MDKKDTRETIYDVKTWLGIHITQLSYTRNLILSIAIASFGFSFSKYVNLSIPVNFFVSAVFPFTISIALGLIISIIQAEAFRRYRKISRMVTRDTIVNIDQDVDTITTLEKVNRYLFWLEIFFLLIGIILLIIKFFPST